MQQLGRGHPIHTAHRLASSKDGGQTILDRQWSSVRAGLKYCYMWTGEKWQHNRQQFDAELCNTACDLQQSATTESVFVFGFVRMHFTVSKACQVLVQDFKRNESNLTVPIKIKISTTDTLSSQHASVPPPPTHLWSSWDVFSLLLFHLLQLFHSVASIIFMISANYHKLKSSHFRNLPVTDLILRVTYCKSLSEFL